MSDLTLTTDEAKDIYKKSSATVKRLLEMKFGKDTFLPKTTDLIKTWADVCKKLGKHPVKCLPYPKPVDQEQEAVNAFAKASMIRKALNDGWEPDWSNSSEYKYYPWLKYNPDKTKPSGFRLSYLVCVYDFTYSFVGSRLCFPTSALAKYAAETFTDVYEKIFIISKPKSKTKK